MRRILTPVRTAPAAERASKSPEIQVRGRTNRGLVETSFECFHPATSDQQSRAASPVACCAVRGTCLRSRHDQPCEGRHAPRLALYTADSGIT